MIFDNAGNLVWFHPLPAGEDAADFRTQDFHGKNDADLVAGPHDQLGYGLGEDVIADANYRTVAIVKAGNGLQADEHEFNAHAAGLGLRHSPTAPCRPNLARAGGPASGDRASTASSSRSTSTPGS